MNRVPIFRKRTDQRVFSVVLALMLWGGLALSGCSQSPASTPNVPESPDTLAKAPAKEEPIVARIAAVGDLMCHSTQFKYATVTPDSFDFRPCFAEVRSYLSGADFTIGNLETVFAGTRVKYEGYPAFNTPDDFLDALWEAGFDFLATSNNHSMDQGEKGTLRTLDVLDQYGFAHTGTYRSPADRDSVRVVDIKGIRMAILNYTYGTNGMPVPADKPWIVNQIDTALVRKDIAAAAALEPDLVTVFFHFGVENQHEPNKEQRRVVEHAIACGADIILGAHPHVIQPVELFKAQGGRLDSGLVAWSMGNFLSNQYWRYTDAGVILNLEITKDTLRDTVYLSHLSYLPTWVYRGQHPQKKIHIVLPAEKGLQDSSYFYLDKELQGKMREAYHDTETYLCKYRKVDLWKAD